MRSILTRLATLGVAGILAASALAPASAATRHKRTAAPPEAQGEVVEPSAAIHARPDWSPVPSAAWQAPNACVSDEGYGRYSSCDGTSM
jgi:hypothetical protein